MISFWTVLDMNVMKYSALLCPNRVLYIGMEYSTEDPKDPPALHRS